MKINGLNINNNGLQHVENRKSAKVSASKSHKSDSVEISQSVKTRNDDIVSRLKPTYDFPPRLDRVKSAEQLVANGSYNSQDYLESLTEKLIDSSALADTVSYISDDNPVNNEARFERVADVQAQAVRNYYDDQKVMEEIAGRLIDALGIKNIM